MLRRLLPFLSALSLVICAATVALWIWIGEVSWMVKGEAGADHYRLQSRDGRLTLVAPPGGDGDPAVDRLAVSLSKDSLQWLAWADPLPEVKQPDPDALRGVVNHFFVRSGPAEPLADTQVHGAAADRALLRLLDDPERFFEAHLLLYLRHTPPEVAYMVDNGFSEGGPLPISIGGVRASLVMKPVQSRGYPVWGSQDGFVVECVPRPDPLQLAGVRTMWHQRLDVVAWSAPYGAVIAVALVAPAMQAGGALFRKLRARRRRLKNRCEACGYDLRATAGPCPECGTLGGSSGGGKGQFVGRASAHGEAL